ncbi:MAG: 5'-nucleotidase C-terminal domain-containing protein [Vicinamibacterales bacterium]
MRLPIRPPRPARLALAGAVLTLAVVGLLAATRAALPSTVTLSIVGTTDLHGRLMPVEGRGGLAMFGGYLANLRAARAADGGAVLLVDSGDTFQGGTESNLSEGAVVVDAYNALGYTAAAIGNHDFEFGAVDTADALDTPRADPRGALKARAAQAHYPLLAANLLEDGRPAAWPNVTPSAMVEAAGVRVGLVGIMTYEALSMTLAANVGGLRTTPLVAAVQREAEALRARGAQVVVVVSHAGGECTSFEAADDLTSCDEWSEIFDLARRLPRGLVDVVMAGHTHAAVAHEVNGIAVAQAYSVGRAFARVDLTVNRTTGTVATAHIHLPQEICGRVDAQGHCAAASSGTPARYEGHPVEADAAITQAMAPALARVAALRATTFGPVFDGPIERGAPEAESPLGNLFADAMRRATAGADAAITYGTGPGGLRLGLPGGPATLGGLYDAFPFDNRVVRRQLTGRDVRQVVANHLRRPRWWARTLGLSGLRVRVACTAGTPAVDVTRDTGASIGDDDRLTVVISDFIAGRDAVRQALADDATLDTTPLVRDLVTRWMRTRPGPVEASEFLDRTEPRWQYDGSCQ